MHLKTRVRRYEESRVGKMTSYFLSNGLAQNVSREQEYLTGDYVLVSNATELMVYMEKVRQFNQMHFVVAEVLVA